MKERTKSVAFGCAVVVTAFVVALVWFCVALYLAESHGFIPSEAAQPGGSIPPRVLRQLEEMGVIEPGELVLYFYSADLIDIRVDGNLFTPSRVISYMKSDGEFTIWSANYDEIESIELDSSNAWYEDSSIIIKKVDGDEFGLYVSNTSSGDEMFFARLMLEWERRRARGKAN